MIINHNMGSINANRMMGINQANAGKSMEKLSSGLRINRAGDDAAGLAISEKMRGQIRGLDQASSNAQDGISMIQTAEGALGETQSILQRMRELAVQSSNGTLTDDDRTKIQAEANQLTQEIDKIGNQTEFNTKKLLDGQVGTVATSNNSFSDATAKTATVVLSTTADTKSSAAGSPYAVAVTTAGTQAHSNSAGAWNGAAITSGDQLVITAKGTSTTINLSAGDDQQAIVDRINATSDKSGVGAYVTNTGTLAIRSNTYGADATFAITGATANVGITGVVNGTASNVTIDGVANAGANYTIDGNTITANTGNAKGLTAKLMGTEETAKVTGLDVTGGAAAGDSITINGKVVTLAVADAADNNSLVNTINKYTRETGVTATVVGGRINLESQQKGTGVGIQFAYTNIGAGAGLNIGDGTASLGNAAATTKDVVDGAGALAGALTASTYAAGTDNVGANNNANITVAANSVDFHVGANAGQTMSLKISDMRSANLGTGVTNTTNLQSVADLSTQNAFSTATKAEDALKVLDQAISSVSNERGNLGAVQNRLEHTIANLGTSSENLTSAESRIRDVNMAKEMSQFSKNNILSQAAQAMLAQANQQPQQVLQLLR